MGRPSNARRQVVMTFDEREDKRDARLRGGKGNQLAMMRSLGLPVPAGFTIAATVARAVMHTGQLPKRVAWQIERSIRVLEQATGKRFGDPVDPLLVSVRSGAEVSMPGMMDTVLNVGINPAVAETLARSVNPIFANDCLERFTAMYGQTVSADIPSDPRQQLNGAIDAVLTSWNSPRARAYRAECGISDTLGTAINVQAMVFGNVSDRSCTGVAFSRNPITGASGTYGEFLPCAQGEDVVSGSRTPLPLSDMATWNADVYQGLLHHMATLEKHLDAIADVEFTVEEGVLYLLQCRPAKLTPEAAATFAVHRVWEKAWSRDRAVQSVPAVQLESLRSKKTLELTSHSVILGKGLAASPGVASGQVCQKPEDVLTAKAEGRLVILVRHETSPDDFEAMLASNAIVTLNGGSTSHAAVVARQLGIPAVVGFGQRSFRDGDWVTVCGTTGVVYAGTLCIVDTVVTKKEVNLLTKWAGGMLPPPRIDFDAVQVKCSVNRILADVYLGEAMLHAARGTSLEFQIRQVHTKTVVRAAEFFACYLAIAVASELRHTWEYARTGTHFANLHALESVYGLHTSGRGDEQILEVLKKMSVPQQIGFFQLATTVFRKGSWAASFGGPLWGNIAEAGARFLSGEWSHALFVDRVFDLRHNGGQIFDKHHMVTFRTDASALLHQLDVKREVRDVGELHQKLLLPLRRSVRFEWEDKSDQLPSAEVEDLWRRGVESKLWKEYTDEPTHRKLAPKRWAY